MREITSRENPLIKEYIKLRDQKKQRNEKKLFVFEGVRITEDALDEGIDINSVFITDDAIMKYPTLAQRIEREMPDRSYRISDACAEKLSDTKGYQGVFCVAGALDKILTADKINKKGKYIILNRLQDPGNVGTIIRVADAVGVCGVVLCGCCDIYNPKTVRSTMGSMFRTPVYLCDYYDAVAAFKDVGAPVYASVIDKDADDLRTNSFEDGCAVVIGNEGNGLSGEEVSVCDKRITIKMNGNINSLNAAMAAGIFLWELTK